jgi:hypothetical protein
MRAKRTAREMERSAAAARPRASGLRTPALFTPIKALEPPVAASRGARYPGSEAAAMLARRGMLGEPIRLDLPFDPVSAADQFERICDHLERYAFRLFLRGAIQRPEGFSPAEATRYLAAAQAEALAEACVELGLMERAEGGRYQLVVKPKSFGGTLEWYIARELERRLGFDVLVGRTFPAPGVGGDLDVVAAAEGKLVYIEAKSSPPKHIAPPEVAAFFDRVRALRPDIAIFAVDTALRLSDKVIPMLDKEMRNGGRGASFGAPRCVERELWALTPHIFAVNARPDLIANIARAVAEGIRALSPAPP